MSGSSYRVTNVRHALTYPSPQDQALVSKHGFTGIRKMVASGRMTQEEMNAIVSRMTRRTTGQTVDGMSEKDIAACLDCGWIEPVPDDEETS